MKFYYVCNSLFAIVFCIVPQSKAADWQHVQFAITQQNKCLVWNEFNIITNFTRISVQKCVSECGNRQDCQAVNYRRRHKICELINTQNGNLVKSNGHTGPCILVVKSDTKELPSCSCAAGEVCDDIFCTTKECKTTALENAETVGNINTIGAQILYNCGPGYVNTGQRDATCLPLGAWSDQPQCVPDCGTPATVSYASLSFDSTILNSVVTYTCINSYAHSGGDLQLVCGSEGQWSGVLPTCSIDCGTPTTVSGASRSFTTTTENSLVTYTCLTGYTQTGGDLQLVCGSCGQWEGVLPLCTVECGPPVTVTGAIRSFTTTTENALVTYTCVTGYTHTEGDLQLVCGFNGQWGGVLPTCTIDCGTPSTVSGASRSFTTTTVNSFVTYTCLTGYIQTGGDLQRVCGSSSLWGGVLPTCVPGCPAPPNVPNSVVSSGSMLVGATWTYTCSAGNYFATGTSVMITTCQTGGQWSNMNVICPTDSAEHECPGCGILRDCGDVQSLGLKQTGTYLIYPKGNVGINVRCDMDKGTGGWTIIQRRISASDFYRTWQEYKVGFGSVNDNYWLGNDNIATLTSLDHYKIRFDLYDRNNVHGYAEYSTFSITDESQNYRLTVSGYSGNASDSFAGVHNGMMFTTKDRDNDIDSLANCASYFTGAWWYADCHDSNLNGVYGSTVSGKGLIWFYFRGATHSLSVTEMKIKRK